MNKPAHASRPVRTPFGRDATATDVLDGVNLAGRRFIVTGGASGLGEAATRALVAAGANVTVAVRDPHSALRLTDDQPLIEALPLDLADLDSVTEFVRAWTEPVDAIIANAGVMAVPTRQLSAAGWELQLATNYLGHFALIYGLEKQLAAASGRVVVVSSGAQLRAGVDLDDLNFDRRPYDPWTAYSQSKSADVLLAVGIARRWADKGVTGNACAPGVIHTNLQRHLAPELMRAMGAMDANGDLIHPEHYKTPEQGASTAVLLAASPLIDGVSGAYFEDNQEAPTVPGGPEPEGGVAEWSLDPGLADALWERAVAALPAPLTAGK